MYAPYLTFYSPPEAVFHDTGNAINYSASPAYLLLLLFAFLLLVSSSPFFHPSCSRLTSPRLFGARVRKCRGGGELARGKTSGTVSINQTVLTMIDPVSASFHGSSGPSVDLIISNVRFWYWNRNDYYFVFRTVVVRKGWGFYIPIVIIASRGRSRFSNGLIIICASVYGEVKRCLGGRKWTQR